MKMRRVLVGGGVIVGFVACLVGLLPLVMGDRPVAEVKTDWQAHAVYREAERSPAGLEISEELRAPLRGPSLPRPEVVRALRRQRAEQ